MMKVAFDEIGRVAATFACDAGEVGKLCKMADNGKVALCAAGDDFIQGKYDVAAVKCRYRKQIHHSEHNRQQS